MEDRHEYTNRMKMNAGYIVHDPQSPVRPEVLGSVENGRHQMREIIQRNPKMLIPYGKGKE